MGFIVKSYALTDSSAAEGISQREGVGRVRHFDTRSLWLQAEVKLGWLTMLKVSTEDNLADIGTKGHDREKLGHLIALNSLIRMNVDNHPGTIAAGATITNAGAAPSSADVRTALTAVAIATAAFLPLAEARGQISVRTAEHPNVLMIMLVCSLVASLVLNVFQGYDAHHRRPRRSTSESAGWSVGMNVGVNRNARTRGGRRIHGLR